MTDDMTIPRKCYSRPVSDLRSFSAKINRLPHLIMELTDRCNNSCQHCYINRPARDPKAIEKEMDTGFIKDLILQAADLGCLDIRFSGGEPLLREDFSEIYDFSRKQGFNVLIFTNARLITPDMVYQFKKLPPRQPIGITVYGMTSETYDKVSGVKGSYAEFRRGIDLLKENHIDFALQMAVLPDNEIDIPAYEKWINKLFGGKQKPVYVANFSQRARHDDPEKNWRIRELRGKAEETVELVARAEGYFSELRDFCRQFTGIKSDRLFVCGFGQSICVDAYGFAQGCQLLRHPDLLYNLHSGTLSEAFFAYFPKFRDRRATNPLFLSLCARCNLRGLCEQCPAQSWMEHGTLDTPVQFQCATAHAHARKLGLLSSEENGWEIADWPFRLK